MSSLRFCGVLVRHALNTQRLNAAKSSFIVPITYKPRDEKFLQIQQTRSFKNFGHDPTPTPKFTRYWHLFIGLLFLGCTLNWES
jgi:hypothetical protein